jgi:hypothetical protein
MRNPGGGLGNISPPDLLNMLTSHDPTALSPFGPGGKPVSSLPPGAELLGEETGAPPHTVFRGIQIAPGRVATRIAEPSRPNRVVIITTPLIGFRFYIGPAGVKVGDLEITPGIPYDCVLPGLQELYAVTNAPVPLSLSVQIAPILIGDRERRWPR